MIKKLYLLVFVLCVSQMFAQRISKRWLIIQELQDKVVYIDKSTLKLENNQLSVWSQVYHRNPITVNPFQNLVSRVKTQFLINTITEKYSVIGTLYYDSNGRIVGETSSSKLAGGDKFMMQIQQGTLIETIRDKSLEYLDKGAIEISKGEYNPPSEPNFSPVAAVETKNETNKIDSSIVNTPPVVEEIQGNNEKPETIKLNKDGYPITVDDDITTVVINEDSLKNSLIGNVSNQIIDGEYETKNQNVSETEQPTEGKNEKVEEIDNSEDNSDNYEFDFDNEKNVGKYYFTDGNKYLIQMSSFKTESVAKKEVERYKSAGHNAFITKVYIKKKRAYYNRVRIGFFDSLQEAKRYRRNLK